MISIQTHAHIYTHARAHTPLNTKSSTNNKHVIFFFTGYKFSAVEAYKCMWRLGAIRNEVNRVVFSRIDVLALPTSGILSV